MKSKNITVFAPATIANVSCGFDTLGFALEAKTSNGLELGDYVGATFTNDNKLHITTIEGATNIPYDPTLNVTTVAAQAVLDAVGERRGMSFKISKTVLPGSGLGSSSSAAVAGAFAANELLGRPFTPYELLPFAGIGEKLASNQLHYDNVAPALLGGFAVVRSNAEADVISIPYPKNMWVVAAHPQVEIKTQQAKRMLGKSMPISNAVIQFGNIAGVVLGISSSNYEVLGRSMVDVLAEPKRKALIPLYDKAKNASLKAGAIGTNIAGSGPTIFSFCKDKNEADAVLSAYQDTYKYSGIEVKYYTSKISSAGAKIV